MNKKSFRSTAVISLMFLTLSGCQTQEQFPPSPGLPQTSFTEQAQLFPLNPQTKQNSTGQVKTPTSFNEAFGINQGNTMQLSPDLQSIISKGDYKGCADLTNNAELETCESALVVNTAITTHDESICDKATLPDVKQRCHDTFKNPVQKFF